LQLINTAAQFKAIYDIVDVIALGRVDPYVFARSVESRTPIRIRMCITCVSAPLG
jgi:hypothetical protein